MIKFAGRCPWRSCARGGRRLPPLVCWRMLDGEKRLTGAWRAVLGTGAIGSTIAMAVGAMTM